MATLQFIHSLLLCFGCEFLSSEVKEIEKDLSQYRLKYRGVIISIVVSFFMFCSLLLDAFVV